MVIKVALRLHRQCPNVVLLHKSGAQSVKLSQCIPSSQGRHVTQALWIRCDSCSVLMLKRLFRKLPNIEDASFSRVGGDTYLGFLENNDCVCLRLGLINEKVSRIVPDIESMLAYIYFKHGKDMRRFLAKLERKRVKYNIEGIEPLKNAGVLTAVQEKILRLAYDHGFYDVPRRISVTKLAQVLGVSAHAVSETIRRSHKKLVENYLKQ